MDYMGPHEIDAGYFEFRLTWSGGDMFEMTGAQLDELQAVVAKAKALVEACESRAATPDRGQP
jgi:hypothetical protein